MLIRLEIIVLHKQLGLPEALLLMILELTVVDITLNQVAQAIQSHFGQAKRFGQPGL